MLLYQYDNNLATHILHSDHHIQWVCGVTGVSCQCQVVTGVTPGVSG